MRKALQETRAIPRSLFLGSGGFHPMEEIFGVVAVFLEVFGDTGLALGWFARTEAIW